MYEIKGIDSRSFSIGKRRIIENAWKTYVNGNIIGSINTLTDFIGDSRIRNQKKEIVKVANFLRNYSFPEFQQAELRTKQGFALAINRSWLFSQFNIEDGSRYRSVLPLSIIIGTEYVLDIDPEILGKEIYGNQFTGLIGNCEVDHSPPYYHLRYQWPELKILPSLSLSARIGFVATMQYVQLQSNLIELSRTNPYFHKYIWDGLCELKILGLVRDADEFDLLKVFSYSELQEFALNNNILIRKSAKENIIGAITANVSSKKINEFIVSKGIGEHKRILISNLNTLKKYIWGEIYRIDLYVNWLERIRCHEKRLLNVSFIYKHPKREKGEENLFNFVEIDAIGEDEVTGNNNVPWFREYYATPAIMDHEQLSFYKYLTNEIEHGRYPSVDGNISYLFAYIYPFIEKWQSKGYEYVYKRLQEIAEAYYSEEIFVRYCKSWAYDCLLGLRKFDEYLSITEPQELLPSFTCEIVDPNERCNISYHLQKPALTKDILNLYAWKGQVSLTDYTREHLLQFVDCVDSVIIKDNEEQGSWLKKIVESQVSPVTNYKYLFVGVRNINSPKLDFPFYDFRAEYRVFLEHLCSLIRKAEDLLRTSHGLPRIGEGWISETELYQEIKKAFPQTPVVHHGKPPWLGNQHLDIWLPEWKIAVEYHGKQHFEPVKFFGGMEALDVTKKRDALKKSLCISNGVILIIATLDDPYSKIIEKIIHSHLKWISNDIVDTHRIFK